MSRNVSLLTVLFMMCYFIAKGRNDVVNTTITRDDRDYFTNVCRNCLKYGAEHVMDNHRNVCKCGSSKWTHSVFLRFDHTSPCKSGGPEHSFVSVENHCLFWEDGGKVVQAIDTERTASYSFLKTPYDSCTVAPNISYLNATDKWVQFSLSGNVLEVQNSQSPIYLQLKVTKGGLTKFKGYIMKLGLKCIDRRGMNKDSCLLFKAKGDLIFPLNCPLPSTTRVPPTTSSTTVSSTVTVTPSSTSATTATTDISLTSMTTSTATVSSTVTVTPSSTSTTTAPAKRDDVWIIVAIAIIGTVLCLSLIGAIVLVLYRYTHICKSRGRRARPPDNNFDVISNPGPQTYTIQEEPLYVEVPDIYPCEKGRAGISTEPREERPSVLLNPYVNEALFITGRRTTDPLPLRPEIDGKPSTRIDARPVSQNKGGEAVDEAEDSSIVLKNQKVEEASHSSLLRSENDFTEAEAPVQDEDLIGHHHHHHHLDGVVNDAVQFESKGSGEDLVYQGLEKGKRPQSVFVCPSCNDNPEYQRLSMPRNCPHGVMEKRKENRGSFYESLTGLERGSRESVYARPLHIAEEPATKEEEKRNSKDVEGLPEYHTLEPGETVSNKDPDESVDHDYKVLEGPEETFTKVDGDTNDGIHDPGPASEDPELPIEPSQFLNIEDNPAYAKPWKTKKDPELPLEPSEVLNIDDNPAYAKPRNTKEDPDLPLDSSEFLKNNPAYAMPWKTKTAEPCVRKRANSM